MADQGNRYSMDGSYDLAWDRTFPIDGDRLWPSGKLLQLQRMAFSSHFRERRHIILLTSRKLIVAEQPVRDPDLPWGILNDGSGYRFYNGDLREQVEYNTTSLTKLELRDSSVGHGLEIWALTDATKAKRVFWAKAIASSKVLKDLADESIRQGIASPNPSPNPLLAPMKGRAIFERQLLDKILERQFKRAAPGVEVTQHEDQMPDEDFRRIIK